MILHGGPGAFDYLNQSGCVRLEGVDDEAKFDALRLAFEVVQIPSDFVDGIFSVLSAVLWLGNLTFKVREGEIERTHSHSKLVAGSYAPYKKERKEEKHCHKMRVYISCLNMSLADALEYSCTTCTVHL